MPRARTYRAIQMFEQIRQTARPPRPRRRCANPRCRCILARDQESDFCSPCQRRMHGSPGAAGDLLDDL